MKSYLLKRKNSKYATTEIRENKFPKLNNYVDEIVEYVTFMESNSIQPKRKDL